MTNIKSMQVDQIYNHFRKGPTKYDEEYHCKLLINHMLNYKEGTYSAFCVKAMISEANFFNWINNNELFRNLYYFTKMIAKQMWEDEGHRIKSEEYQMGTVNYEFEHWKLIGWSRFGVSKNSRLKLTLKPNESPAQHYAAILTQAAEGDFTASEFKQLMEAVNVGLNVHQVYELQKQIDELKSDLAIVTANTHVENPFSNKGTT